MKNISKRITALIMIVAIVMSVVLLKTTNVNAAGSAVTLSTSTKELKAGDTITINVSLGSGFNGFSAKLQYDTSIFEQVSMAKTGDWNVDLASSNIVTVDRATATSSTEQVATITLKVKAGITATSATVTLTTIKASTGSETQVQSDAKATFGKAPTTPSGSQTPTGTTPKDVSKTTTAAKSSTLPKAGLETGILLVVMLGAIVGIIFYIKLKKIKKYED